jgi:hypothetical protein
MVRVQTAARHGIRICDIHAPAVSVTPLAVRCAGVTRGDATACKRIAYP